MSCLNKPSHEGESSRRTSRAAPVDHAHKDVHRKVAVSARLMNSTQTNTEVMALEQVGRRSIGLNMFVHGPPHEQPIRPSDEDAYQLGLSTNSFSRYSVVSLPEMNQSNHTGNLVLLRSPTQKGKTLPSQSSL